VAQRTKTIEFATSVDTTTLASATQRTKTVTVYIPESSVTFKNVTMRAHMRDAVTTAASGTTPALSIQLDSVSASSANASNPPANSGEHQTFVFSRDVTSYFTTNWTGTSMVATLGITLTGPITANHWFKLIITYEYSDASSTQIKTVRIPIESTRQYATTSWQTVGGATTIPALSGGFLPENSYTIRQISIELWGNEGAVTAVTDHTLSIRVNGGTTRAVWFGEMALDGNALHFWTAYDATSETTYGSARSLEILTDLTSTFARVGGMIVVTYEFALSGTTTVLNSLILGAIDTMGQVPGTTSGDQEAWSRTIYVEEPTTITLVQSGVCLFAQSSAPNGGTLNVLVGAQSNTGYSMAGNSDFELGPHSLVHRIDSGGTAGANFATLARGVNTYTLKIYASAANVWWNLSGFLLLNYTSGVHADGPGAHAHTVHNLIKPNDSTSSQNQTSTGRMAYLSTTEDDAYYVVGVVCEMIIDHGSNVACYGYALNAARAAGEGPGSGWETFYSGVANCDTERSCTVRCYSASRTSVDRWPGETDADRLDPLTSRSWRLDLAQGCYAAYGCWLTYHCISYEVAGTVSGYADADGAGLTVDVFRTSDMLYVGSATTTAGGAYTLTVYDDVGTFFGICREDSTHCGRSDNVTPT
jgi:hypothetical protein